MLCKGTCRRFHDGSDPNGIRTRVTAVKGRCPGPLDDRVTKAGQYRIVILSRKANCRIVFQGFSPEATHPPSVAGSDLWRDEQRRGYGPELSS